MATTARTTMQTSSKERATVRPADLVKKTILYVVLTVLALLTAYPFWWMLIAATRRSATILTTPPPFWFGDALLKNYTDLMKAIPFWRAGFNSLLVAAISTVLVLFFCSLAGFGFAKYDFKGKNALFAIMLATLMIPEVLGVIPSYMLMRWLGWLNTYLPLIVPGAAPAFGIFWMRQYITGAVPREMLDAARLDGAREFRIYWTIVLPVIRPALATLAIITFLGKWNDFFWPLLILKDQSKYTLPVALASLQNLSGQELGVQLLGSTIAIVPILLLFLLAARQFMAGLTAGAVK